MSRKTIYIVILAVLVVGVIFWPVLSNQTKYSASSSNNLHAQNEISHAHGLAVDIADPTNLYIATHHGLLLLQNEKDLYRIGSKTDDYMGFTIHPTEPKTFFSSGHSSKGGNLGFQKSGDGGLSWEKVSDGLDGPVDFHALAISAVNPELIYGWFADALQKTKDEGKTWEKVSTSFPIVNIAADPMDEDILYAASRQGLFVSRNQGQEWNSLIEGFVSTIAINPQNTQILISFSEKQGLAKSSNAGKDWQSINEKFNGETPLYIVFSNQQQGTLYLLTQKNSLYKSRNNGDHWERLF